MAAVEIQDLPNPGQDPNQLTNWRNWKKVKHHFSYYNVKDYGAKGDGTTVDTAAIQRAIDAAAATVVGATTGGAIVYFPPGVYLSGALLCTSPYVSFRGDGPAASEIISSSAGGTSLFKMLGSSTPGVATGMFSYIKDIRFRYVYGTWTNILHLRNLSEILLENVRVDGGLTGSNDVACLCESALIFTMFNCRFSDGGNYALDICKINPGVTGDGEAYPNNISLFWTTIRSGGKFGMRFRDGEQLKMYGGDIESNGTASSINNGGIFIDKCGLEAGSGIVATLNGLWFEQNAGIDLKLGEVGFSAGYVNVENCNMLGSGGSGGSKLYSVYGDVTNSGNIRGRAYFTRCSMFNAATKDIYFANDYVGILRDCQAMSRTLTSKCTALPDPLNNSYGQLDLGLITYTPETFNAGETAPAINRLSPIKSFANAGATTVTSLTGCSDGIILTLYSTNGTTTLKHRHSGVSGTADEMDLPGAANYRLEANESIQLIRMDGHWYPVTYPQPLRAADSPTFAGGTFTGPISVDTRILSTSSTLNIRPNTSDGSDTARVVIGAGGADGGDVTRGAYLAFRGNENSGTGAARMAAGNVTGGTIILATGNDVARLTIDDDGFAHFSGALDAVNIHPKTSDTADNGITTIGGGGADGGDVTRGAYASFRGNENSGTGKVRVAAGNVTGGTIILATGNDVAAVTIDESGVTTLANLAGSGSRINVSSSTGVQSSPDTLPMLIRKKVTDAITASTTQTQGQGALVSDHNVISVCANANDTVTLPAAASGYAVRIRNNGAQTLQIFPSSGDAINAGAVDASTTLAAGASVTYWTANATTWYS